MNKNIAMVIVGVLILLGGGAFLLAQNKATKSVSPTPEVMHAQTTPSPTAMPSMSMEPSGSSMEASMAPSGTTGKKAVKEFTVTASNFKFDVSTIKVNKGDTVTINFKNSEGFHDFVIDEFNAKTKIIPAGQTDTVQFTADKAGSFDFYCSVGNHRQMGMQGTLIVQ